MRRQLLLSAILVAASAATTAAQQAPSKQTPQSAKQVMAAGVWNGKSMTGAKDSVVTTYTLWIAPDGKSATIKFPNRDAIPSRVAAMGGDSIVIETGPYPSILRPGQTVDLVRTVVHVKGDMMMGAFETRYAGGDVVKGKMEAMRGK